MTPLRKIRQARGVTLIELGKAVGLDVGNLSRLERMQQGATPALAERIARYFEYGISELEILYPTRFMFAEDEAAATHKEAA